MKPTVKCPECYSTELYKFGKDKHSNQKYLCKRCRRQFTSLSVKKLNNPKCPVCGKGMYLHHKYKYHVSFKCNNRKCTRGRTDEVAMDATPRDPSPADPALRATTAPSEHMERERSEERRVGKEC